MDTSIHTSKLLGLAVFINFFGLPRSAPMVGGLVLTLMTLPTIIIASRAALKSVPPSIREAALGMGASKMQTITHHVLPLARQELRPASIRRAPRRQNKRAGHRPYAPAMRSIGSCR